MKHAQLDMGMFWLHNPTIKMSEIFPCWLHNPTIRMSEIFPWDLPDRVCIHFCCRGRECKRELETACLFFHPCSSEELTLETIELICNHFIAKIIGWFNEYHFLKVAGLKLRYKALLAGKDGPISKMA
jgi:hypothetical protein